MQPQVPQGYSQAPQQMNQAFSQAPQQIPQGFSQAPQQAPQGFSQVPHQGAVQGFTPYEQGAAEAGPRGFAPAANGTLILEAGQFTCYLGGGLIGVVQGQGYIDVYDDRIEFRKTHGASWGYAANPIVGVLAANRDKKKNPKETYYFSDIKNIKPGKYSGMIPTFILEFAKGKSLSFAKTAKSRAPKEVIDIVKRYIH